MNLGTVFLYLHIGGAIVAFGPTIAFPFFAARASKEPMHGNFVLRVTEFITERVVEPGAIFVFLMGVALIITRGYSLVDDLWVTAAIVLFLITLGFSYFVQLPRVRKMVAMTDRPPAVAPGASEPMSPLAGSGAAPGPGGGPAGPPPEFVALAGKAARGGQLMTLLLFAILFLMVFKPF
jgi:uncharacterized membrane protein